MNLKLKLSPSFLLLLNAVGIALVAGTVVLLLQLDGVVNSTLYSYGLMFNYEWATPYWMFLRLALGLLCGIIGINAFSFVYVILNRKDLQRQLPAIVPSKPAVATRRLEAEKEREKEKETRKEAKENGVEIAAIPMVCNKCGKVFTQPLCMFDFKTGKPRLVNVCPYCNALLAASATQE
jgi:hypothetical protein